MTGRFSLHGHQLGVACCVALALVASPAAASPKYPSAVVHTGDVKFWAEPGVWSAPLPDEKDNPPMLQFRVPSDTSGCTQDTSLPSSPPFALVVARGGCSFSDKASVALASGASAVIIGNSLEGMYNAASTGNVGPKLNTTACDYDCTKGFGTVSHADVSVESAYAGYTCTSGTCEPNRCVLTGIRDDRSGDHSVCCFTDDMMDMGGDVVDLPAVFITLDSYDTLTAAVATAPDAAPLTGTVAVRHLPTVDPSSVIIWGVGVLAAAAAAYRSAEVERRACKSAGGGAVVSAAPAQHPPELDSVSITVQAAGAFLVVATVVLLSMFFLIKWGVPVVYIIIFIFAIGSVSSFGYIAVRPVVQAVWRAARGPGSIHIPWCGPVPRHTIATLPLSLAAVVWWVVERHAPYAFVLQDVFGLCLCCLFLLQVRLPNVKVAVVLLVAFFLYDIFMVFISPVFFGDSVMVNVATAGMPTAVANELCYCRLHPDDSKHCGPGESMPILFKFPRLEDYRGGAAMLGLGDVVLPGLLLSFAARFDYATAGSLKRGYFATLMVGYAVGLAGANLGVLLMNQGQPALLYIVPATLVPFVVLAWCRGQLRRAWQGDGDGSASGAGSASGSGAGAGAVNDIGDGRGAHVPLTTDTDDGVDVEMVVVTAARND